MIDIKNKRIYEIDEILNMSKLELAMEMLSYDLLFHKIPSDKILYYVSAALEIGLERSKEYDCKSIEELCHENDIEIVFSSATGKYLGVRIRSEIVFSESKKQIIIYKDSVEEISLVITKCLRGDKHFSYQAAVDMHIAHEFFHFLEWRDRCPVNEQLPSIVISKIFGYKRKATILTLSEIAAHNFCQEVLGLPHFPYLYDKIYALLI